jgi:hypothetical protein
VLATGTVEHDVAMERTWAATAAAAVGPGQLDAPPEPLAVDEALEVALELLAVVAESSEFEFVLPQAESSVANARQRPSLPVIGTPLSVFRLHDVYQCQLPVAGPRRGQATRVISSGLLPWANGAGFGAVARQQRWHKRGDMAGARGERRVRTPRSPGRTQKKSNGGRRAPLFAEALDPLKKGDV